MLVLHTLVSTRVIVLAISAVVGCAAGRGDNNAYDDLCQNHQNNTEQRIDDCALGIANLISVTTGRDIFEAAIDDGDDCNCTDYKTQDVYRRLEGFPDARLSVGTIAVTGLADT